MPFQTGVADQTQIQPQRTPDLQGWYTQALTGLGPMRYIRNSNWRTR